MMKSEQANDLIVRDLPLLRDSEHRHILVAGDPGVGKSQAIMQVLDEIRARGERAFVYDVSGEFTQHFYREGVDVLLAPFDSRSQNWTPFCESTDDHDLARVASAFCPPGIEGDTSKHWDDAAYLVFTSLLQALSQSEAFDNSNTSIVQAITKRIKRVNTTKLGEEVVRVETLLDALLKGTLAEGIIDSDAPLYRSDVLTTLISKIRPLHYMLGLETQALFSVTDWVKGSTNNWVFVRVDEQQLNLCQTLITAWVNMLVTAVLDREPHPTERLWFITDEAQTLGRITALGNALEKGQEYNFSCVLGVSAHKKMEQIYGEQLMSSLLSSVSTRLCYRYSEPSASAWVSTLLEERVEGQTGMGYSTTEVQHLDELKCYVKLPGDVPAACVNTPYRSREAVADEWIKRQIPDPLVIEETVMDKQGEAVSA